MSRFFTLGGREATSSHQQQDTSNNFFLFKNQEIYNKGFELWHHYHHQNLQQDTDHSPLGPSRRINGCDEPGRLGFTVTMEGGGGGGGGGSINCQDCGNQAKKDCVHMRCRTCCKGRGFECPTHVKSTWVSASRRRERQHQFSGDFQQQNQDQDQQNQNQQNMNQEQQRLSLGGENPKRQRENVQGLQVGNFPAEVNSPAVFRCVRVNAMDDTEEQYAYQTAVNIGGHVFKGILYDQGRESRYGVAGEGSSGGGGGAHQGNLITATATATAATAADNPGFTLHDPSSYPSQLNAFFMAGTQFFPPPRP